MVAFLLFRIPPAHAMTELRPMDGRQGDETMTTRIKGREAIGFAERQGLTLCKYNDPVEGAREGLSAEEAREIAREDPSLIYLDVDGDRAADLCIEVAALVGDDGTGDLGIIVRQALSDDANATAESIAEIVREARRDWAAERAHQASLPSPPPENAGVWFGPSRHNEEPNE